MRVSDQNAPPPSKPRRTIRTKKLTIAERDEIEEDLETLPATRRDCLPGGANAQRPCPFVSCGHRLCLEVADSGNTQLNFPGAEVDALPETCSIDVADKGGLTLEEISKMFGLTRERIRQIEFRAMKKSHRLRVLAEDD